MANTINNLIPDAYVALDKVSKELVGAIPGVTRDAKLDRMAEGQSVRVPQAPSNTTSAFTPSMSVPSAADQTIGNVPVTLSKNKYGAFSWTGEEMYALDAGPEFAAIRQDQITQAIRPLINEIEGDLCDALAAGASRAYGTAGTTPFASNLADPANVRKILDDNGAPPSDRSLVVDTAAGAKLRTLTHLTKANEAGTAMTLRDGELLNIHGFAIRESAQINNSAAGTGTSYVLDGAHAVGDTTITLKTGSGTVLAGDVITIGSHKYVVATGVAAAGDITIGAPGLQAAGADGDTVTINAVSTRNLAFTQNAAVLATRVPMFPDNDLAQGEHEVITDPRTGISFDFRIYPGDGMVLMRVHALWGVKVIKPEHAAILLG